jgi:hypothetical protein
MVRGDSLSEQYSKWDQLEDDDPEIDDGAVIPSQKSHVDHGEEQALAQEFQRYIRLCCPSLKEEDRTMLSNFISVQHKREEACNTTRHCDIIAITEQFPELVSQATLKTLCELQTEMTKDRKSDKASEEDKKNDLGVSNEKAVADGQIVGEAINTLAACKAHGGAIALFEQICTPKTKEQKDLRQRYAKQEFAKEVSWYDLSMF